MEKVKWYDVVFILTLIGFAVYGAITLTLQLTKPQAPKTYEAEIVEKHDSTYYTVKICTGRGGLHYACHWQYRLLESQSYEYEIGDTAIVVIVSDFVAVSYIDYVDQTIDGYKWCKGEVVQGEGWCRE
jgi:hypothetical protein